MQVKSDRHKASEMATSMKQTADGMLGFEDNSKLAKNTNISGNEQAKQTILRMMNCLSRFSATFHVDSREIDSLAKAFDDADESYKNIIKHTSEW